MAASLLGTTGNWGIANDQDGILITDLSFDFSNQEKPVLDKGGEIIGLSLYQEKVEIKLSGLVKKDSPFAYIKRALLDRERLVDKVQQNVPLGCVRCRGKIAFIPLDASPATEDLFLRQL